MRRIAIAVVLALALGLHWGVLQTLAWATMLARYASDSGLDLAVSMTFDGEHPCGLCAAIDAAWTDAPERPAPPPLLDLPKAVLPERQDGFAAGAGTTAGVARREPGRLEGIALRPPRPRPRS